MILKAEESAIQKILRQYRIQNKQVTELKKDERLLFLGNLYAKYISRMILVNTYINILMSNTTDTDVESRIFRFSFISTYQQ